MYLCLTNQALCHEGVWGSGCIDPHFLDLGTSWRWWSASQPGRFTPGERASSIYWIGGWVDPRAGVEDAEKRKFLTIPGLELRLLGRPACNQSLYRLGYPGSKLSISYLIEICLWNPSWQKAGRGGTSKQGMRDVRWSPGQSPTNVALPPHSECHMNILTDI
jgi:hypothetical protein